MAASRNDSFQLAQDVTFQNRVQSSLLAACVSISNEGWAVAFHRERSQFVSQVLSNKTTQSDTVILFSNTVAVDANVLADATQAGTVALTSGNRAAQAALVTDAHIDTAIASQFNSFIREPGN
jgi:hypothetical protein